MNTGDYIELGSVISTILVSIVALFKEWIVSLFKKVNFNIALQEEGLYEEVINQQAIRYFANISIVNCGKLYAQECSVYMESARFYIQDGEPSETIHRLLSPILWDTQNIETGIPPKGHRIVEIFKMIAPANINDPNGNYTEQPKYYFAGIGEKEARKGRWVIIYSISSKDGTSKKFKTEVSWNGEWQTRLAEMKSRITVKVEEI